MLEISEWEWHHEILLTAKNLSELSRSPSPYIIPVIPRPLPVEIVEVEHYVIVDLLILATCSSSPANNFETEAVSLGLVISTQSGQPSSTRGGISALSPKHLRRTIGVVISRVSLLRKKGSRPAPQASKKERRVPERLKTPKARVEDFVPWVSPISSLSLAREKEEEEEEMVDLVHNFEARKRNRGANFKQATGATPEVASEVSQQASGESLGVQATVVSDSPDMGFHGQSASETALLVDLGEVSPTHTEVQEDIPSE